MAKATMPITKALYKMFSSTALPVYERVQNTGTPLSSPIFINSGVQVLSLDQNWNRDFYNTAGSLRF